MSRMEVEVGRAFMSGLCFGLLVVGMILPEPKVGVGFADISFAIGGVGLFLLSMTLRNRR